MRAYSLLSCRLDVQAVQPLAEGITSQAEAAAMLEACQGSGGPLEMPAIVDGCGRLVLCLDDYLMADAVFVLAHGAGLEV